MPQLDVTPDVAFQQAKELGRLAELDSVCRNAANYGSCARNAFSAEISLYQE